jgi:2-(3-amino-3-carboxypropyl)histidine synthase
LLIHASLIADLITTFCSEDGVDGAVPVECLILGDVTYGACCIDDLASKKLGCQFIVHYGHSCLVPIPEMTISNVLYVFVEIGIDLRHLVDSIAFNLDPATNIYLMGIVQFNTTLVRAKQLLEKEKGFTSIQLPQTKPRSKGEVLGCTSPLIAAEGTVVFIGDGRFHIESCMIRNPHLTFLQYDPFKQQLTEEVYKTE